MIYVVTVILMRTKLSSAAAVITHIITDGHLRNQPATHTDSYTINRTEAIGHNEEW